ncbi:3-hydroxyacyl-CoA dehydrogenase [Sulfolobus sp. S-194]|uniref:3-hydroxyacyl-CoA dehydrogenase n=1 Tax=Sulfolobus sp. S-194 TaxID=2512240 RepID=UPI0014370DC5|nr:3-hydroxyacyl-CoA dehydrogenase [Sulfolobus sp. S-194]QIW25191.1 3-hydroxyacyl-CoA dehydrogenase [Sulfolobus sp. S-194]
MKVAVIGAGVMGHGIAEVFSLHDNEVYLYDKYPNALEKGLKNILWSLNKLKEKGKITDVESIFSRIRPINDLSQISDAELVIEAVSENLDLKSSVFKQVSKIVSKYSIIATNTSSLPISELAQSVENPQRFLGLHFFNPPVLMKLVEVVKGAKTDDLIFSKGIEIVKNIEKVPIPVRKDVIGFVVNRILFRIFTSACKLLKNYTVEEIDSLARYVLEFPMGIFELLDYTGIDTNYLISNEVKKRGFDFTCEKLKELYEKGYYGAKVGKGFYDWSNGRPEIRKTDRIPKPEDLLRDAINEAIWLVKNNVSTEEEIELATKLGLGLKKGIFTYARELSIK